MRAKIPSKQESTTAAVRAGKAKQRDESAVNVADGGQQHELDRYEASLVQGRHPQGIHQRTTELTKPTIAAKPAATTKPTVATKPTAAAPVAPPTSALATEFE